MPPELHPELIAGRALPGPPAAIVPTPTEIVRPAIEDVEISELEEENEEEVIVFRPGMTLSDMERAAITATLRDLKGNRRRAAAALGMGERTLYRKIKEYEIPL